MTSVVLERIADGVFVSLLLRGLLFVVHTDAPEARLARAGANAMFLIFLVGSCCSCSPCGGTTRWWASSGDLCRRSPPGWGNAPPRWWTPSSRR